VTRNSLNNTLICPIVLATLKMGKDNQKLKGRW